MAQHRVRTVHGLARCQRRFTGERPLAFLGFAGTLERLRRRVPGTVFDELDG